ncbi:hypothetical protein LCGC14_1085060 [marine sediment metagenome]|uniref:Uncharacterized protein n=1 Tax=marine sediment metagenome TaxID=412755 RepID=A0A0F9QK13_9ZZZZ
MCLSRIDSASRTKVAIHAWKAFMQEEGGPLQSIWQFNRARLMKGEAGKTCGQRYDSFSNAAPDTKAFRFSKGLNIETSGALLMVSRECRYKPKEIYRAGFHCFMEEFGVGNIIVGCSTSLITIKAIIIPKGAYVTYGTDSQDRTVLCADRIII